MILSRKLLSLLLFALSLNLLAAQEVGPKKQVPSADTLKLTVFVHGSIHCHLMMLSPQAVWKDSFEEDAWYVRMLSKVRQNSLLWQSRFMLGMGAQEVTPNVIERFHKRVLTLEESKIAAYQVVAVYDAIARHLDSTECDRAYYMYGHLGLLSQSYRKGVGHELYLWLANLVTQYKTQYKNIHIDIVAHSHGGNICLWLGEFETHYQRGLHVDNLVMYATPIQVETFRFAYKPAFGRVINAISDGDHVQGMDRMSTAHGKSYKKFSDPRLPVSHESSNVFDVRLQVNQKRRHVGHANMFLMDCSSPATQVLKPAPFVVLTPALLSACQDLTRNSFDCNVVDSHHAVYLQLQDHEGIFATSDDFASLSRDMAQLLTYNWRPDYPARLRSQPARLGRITIDAVKELWQGGAIKNEDMPKLISKL